MLRHGLQIHEPLVQVQGGASTLVGSGNDRLGHRALNFEIYEVAFRHRKTAIMEQRAEIYSVLNSGAETILFKVLLPSAAIPECVLL